jgi:transcriptional regulator with XRE-family HTH domain
MTEQPAPPQALPQWDVADRLRKALRHAGIGTTEMADYLGVSRQSVGNWMNGRIEPSQQTLRLWALRCGVSFEWLAGGPVFKRRGGKSAHPSISALIYTFARKPFPSRLAA